MKGSLIAVLLILALAVTGCGQKTQVTRIETDSTVDLSGRWNDTDSRLVAEAVVADCLASRWIGDHVRETGKLPVVIIGNIRNKTSDHIATELFLKDLERALVASGQVSLVASSEEREQLRDERLDQLVNADKETVKAMGRELGADYMLIGVINSQNDQEGGKKVVFYQTDLEMVNIESNVKVWMGFNKIKKLREQKRWSG